VKIAQKIGERIGRKIIRKQSSNSKTLCFLKMIKCPKCNSDKEFILFPKNSKKLYQCKVCNFILYKEHRCDHYFNVTYLDCKNKHCKFCDCCQSENACTHSKDYAKNIYDDKERIKDLEEELRLLSGIPNGIFIEKKRYDILLSKLNKIEAIVGYLDTEKVTMADIARAILRVREVLK
jgi:hypothetical protein